MNKPNAYYVPLLLACLLLGFGVRAGADIIPPNLEYREETTDLKVKVLGGYVSVIRTRLDWEWDINRQWKGITFTYDSLDGSIKTISRAGTDYLKKSPGVYVLDSRNTILITASGFRWQDNIGNWIDYDQNGRTNSYGNRNNVKVSFQYDASNRITGVLDHFDNQVLWYEYTGDYLTAIRDATGRRVQYEFTTLPNSGGAIDLTKVTDANGNAWTYAYETGLYSTATYGTYTPVARRGRLSSRTDPEGRTQRIVRTGSSVSEQDSDNIGTAYLVDYDAANKITYTRETSPTGKISESWTDFNGTVIRRDINGKTVSTTLPSVTSRADTTTDARGNKTTTVKDEWDNVLSTTYADGTTTSATYDPQYSNPLTRTDELGIITKYEYDTKGNLIKLTEALNLPEQRVTEFSYDQYGQFKTMTRKGDTATNTPDALIKYDYDNKGNLIQVIDAENNITLYPSQDYDVQGNPKKKIDARGKVWTSTYDNKGNVLTITDPLNHTNITGYDKSGWRISTTDASSNVTQYIYDARQNVIVVTDPYGNMTRNEYNADNKLTKVTDSEKKVVETIEYDLDGRVSKQIDGNGNTTTYVFGDDVSGLNNLLVRIVYPTYNQEFKYDIRDRVVESIDVLDANTKLGTKTAFDAKGYLKTTIDKEGNATIYTFDALGRPRIITNSANGVTEYTYNSRDNLIVIKDSKNQIHRLTYDRLNHKLTEARPMGQILTYSYTATGELNTRIDPKGHVKKYTYDDSGRMIAESHYLSSIDLTNNNDVRTTSYSYNNLDRPTGYSDGVVSAGTTTYDPRGLRKISESVNYGSFSLSYSYNYFANGLKQSFTGPDGATVNYSYDANNQLATVQLPAGNITVNSYKWIAPSQITFPGGTVRTQNYDPLMRITQLAVKDPGQSELMNVQYGYDAASNIKTKTTEYGNYSYGYDNLYRLISASNPNPLPTEIYTYDSVGNRLTDTKTTQAWGYNDNNQLQGFDGISFDYDANGNTIKKTDANDPTQTRNYVYDTSNRLIEVRDQNNALIATYTYDPFNRRIAKETTGSTGTKTYFIYADEGLIAETSSSGTVTKTYGYRPDSTWSTDPLYLKEETSTYYFQNDHLGTPQKLIAQNGMVAWSSRAEVFGVTMVDASSTIINNLRLPGQYFDQETGLHYNRNRYYDPSISRYLTSDPIGLIADLNIYRYALSNPASYFDETGLIPSCKAYYIGPWELAPPLTKNRKENNYFRGIKTTLSIDGTGTEAEGPEPGKKWHIPLCPSLDVIAKVYKEYVWVFDWDLFNVYKREEKYECIDDCPLGNCCNGPVKHLIPKVGKREEFVKHVSGNLDYENLWFSFKYSISLCSPLLPRPWPKPR
jgi:RHS repeat-associated protein